MDGGGTNLQQRHRRRRWRQRMKWVNHLVMCYPTVLGFEANDASCVNYSRGSTEPGTRQAADSLRLCDVGHGRVPLILELVAHDFARELFHTLQTLSLPMEWLKKCVLGT